MDKEQRDRVMTSLSTEERNSFRQLIARTQQERKASSSELFTARDVLESQKEGLAPQLQAAIDAVIARDELGPAAGQPPPDFNLKLLGSEERVRLSSFRGKRPVALIFGSYT
ncbi:MAG: hypothetical protein BZY88_13955 [SAR202 cluster bacterium Io17-Chloro-G9]|nr:MAG: hypothetical protein BZY88_13955 [SAR202 cluster bacterium Io17-Chloro-G9]